MPDQKNLILAIVISMALVFGFPYLAEMLGFQYFPSVSEEEARLAEQQAAGENGGGQTAPGGDVAQLPAVPGLPGPAAEGTVSRAEALAAGGRVRIDTPRLHGSLALQGARLDDLTLADYRETVDPRSPEIVLLSPRGAPKSYYADFGWTAVGEVRLPDADTLWTADRDTLTQGEPVTLTWDNGQGLTFERRISVDRDYMFTVEQSVTNTGETPVTLAPYARILRFSTPPTLGFFILHEGPYGVFDGTLKEYGYDDLQEEGTIIHPTTGGWLGFTDKYWLVALAPDQTESLEAQFVHRAEEGEDRYFATYGAPGTDVAPGTTVTSATHLFAGAKEVALIDQYRDRYGIDKFDLAIDFGWFYFLTKPFFYILAWIHGMVGNFGIAILVFTVAIKALFFPLANKSYKSMSRMKALQPEMMKLRDRFKDDRQKMNMELMALYKREKVNPASGCLPIVVQIPVFFALYKVFFVTIEMRHAPFFGWIRDLSAPDPTTVFNLFGLIPWDPPSFLMIGAWPLIMGVTMWFQQKLNPAPADPMQQRIFMMLPIVFTFMLAPFAAGLVIYWAWNNSLSILQQWVIMRRMGVRVEGGVDKKPAEPAPATKPAEPARPGRKRAAAAAAARAERSEAPAAGEADPAAPPEGEAAPAAGQQRAAGQGRGQRRRRSGADRKA